jgi:Cu2+-exporting ATPase
VLSASVSLPGRSALVDYDPDKISLETMKKEVNGIGYDLVIEKDRSVEEIQKREYTLLKRKTLLSWPFSILVMSVSMHWLPLGSRDMANQVSLLLALAKSVWWTGILCHLYLETAQHGAANMTRWWDSTATVSS